ncbi:response regulator transcription factor [Nitratifractor salsuginis]|uniref:Two component transcriptional regulator, winged helix family n=1 Tax=Nitratifractor salsuginis (strain DSM 16511 / JCM 12458 / E9I37-1) TaxID=749222 RepID=E6WXR6_NITSE|nr:response regulator transcription factor [Nitratifractor salsuginis]ADV46323.1 two component transcriptional regulator, winged helix family [Nitratifractor salsuginis DSM 16511]
MNEESKVKILLVEDDVETSEFLSTFLRDSGFDVDTVFSVTDALSHLKQNPYDILLLDVNLPDYSGMELLKSIKGELSLPTIILSAYGDTRSKIMAFRYGATDYMVKPIDLEELEARIWVQLGKNSKIPSDFEEEAFRIDTSDILLYGKPLGLTWTEFKILQLLLQNKNRTVTRDRLLSILSTVSSNRSLDNHIKNIRKKIAAQGGKNFLKTEYGMGYRLIDNP